MCRSDYRIRCKRCVQTWSFLADWKRLMLQKGFSNSFWCTCDKWWGFFWQCLFLKERKMLYSSVTTGNFFSQAAIIFATIFVNLSTEKHLYCQLIVAFEKKTWKFKLKEDEIIGGRKDSYFRRLFGPLHRKQEISKVLYSFFVWSMKWVERVFRTIIVQWKQSSSSQKKHDRPSTNLLFVCWLGKLELLFFCGRNVSCLICFFLSFKQRF